jgi:hypothetical protein
MGVSTAERRTVSGHEIAFITEATLPGFMHACSVDDVVRVLHALPQEDWAGIQAIVFRQLTRKERMLSPRWGQIAFGDADEATMFLVACDPSQVLRWPLSIIPSDSAELDRLRQDGHDVQLTARGWEIVSTLAAVRRTQLGRTIPREVGHWVDHRASVARGGGDTRSNASKELFAEQYAAKAHPSVSAALASEAA